MARNDAGPRDRRSQKIPELREEFWKNVQRAGQRRGAEPVAREGRPRGRLPRARRAACASTRSQRDESCGGHFREEYQTPEGEAHARRRELLLRGGLGVQGRRGHSRRCCTRSRSTFENVHPRAAELQVRRCMNLIACTSGGRRARAPPGRFVTYEAQDVSPDMSFLEMLDVVNEELIAQGRGADRVRPRLPRGHLRHVRLHDQRRGRTGRARGTTVCQLHMRHFKDGDALYIEPWRAARLPGDQGPGGRPQRLRPHHRGRRLHLRDHRQRARRQRHPDAEGQTPTGRWTPPRASAAAPAWPPARTPRRCCSPPPRSPTSALLPQGQPERYAARAARWSRRWTPRASAAAPTTASARRSARRRSRSTFIARMNRDFLKATLLGAEEREGEGGAG